MISLSQLNKLKFHIIFFVVLIFNTTFAEEEGAIDIWQGNENENQQTTETNEKKKLP